MSLNYKNIKKPKANSNETDKVASFYVSDEYMVNSVMMNLNKKKLKELRELLLDADVIAKENAMLDNLNLGEFQSSYENYP
jgi:hypothetical protein